MMHAYVISFLAENHNCFDNYGNSFHSNFNAIFCSPQ